MEHSIALAPNRRLQDKALLGIFLNLVGIALYPLSDALIKYLMETYSVPQATFLRAFTRIIPLVILIFFQGGFKHVFSPQQSQLHLVRLLVNMASTFCFMYAFSSISLTTIYIFGYTTPIFMLILSCIFLKESVKFDKWISVSIGIICVLVAMRPGSHVVEIAALLVLLASFLAAFNKVLMRRLASTEHSLAISIYPNILILLLISPYLFLAGHWQSMSWLHWGIFALVGALTGMGQYAMAQALRFAQSSTLAPTDYSSFFWVIMLDLLGWNKSPDQYTLISAAIIVLSNFFLLYKTNKEEK
jgi:S-adenosylmethionine uptake transporter